MVGGIGISVWFKIREVYRTLLRRSDCSIMASQDVQCPICNECFSSSKINTHVNWCLGDENVRKDSSVVRDVKSEASSGEEPKKKRLKSDAEVAKNSPAIPNEGAMAREKKGNWNFMMGKKQATVSPGKCKAKFEQIKAVCDDKAEPVVNVGSNFLNVPRKTPCFSESKAETSKTLISNKDSHMDIHSNVPLAERMRPVTLDGYIGQDQAIGGKKLLRSLFEANKIPSMILWGPPGCGKVTSLHYKIVISDTYY